MPPEMSIVVPGLNHRWLQELVTVIRSFRALFEVEKDCGSLMKIQDEVEEVLAAWRVQQAQQQELHKELQQEVAAAERKLVSARMDGSDENELGQVKEQLAQAQSRERQMQKDVKELEDCIAAIEEQMEDIKQQKETMEQPDSDEAFLKNELSLFLNVSSILPDLGDPKFSGTFVDKKRGVTTFKFSAEDMSQFETCKAAWEMMR